MTVHDLDQLADLIADRLAEQGRPPLVYTVRTLAAEVECSPEAIGRAIRAGELPATRRCGKWIICADDAAQWARTGQRPTVRAARRTDPPGRHNTGPTDTPGTRSLLGLKGTT